MAEREKPAAVPLRLIHFSDLHLWRYGLDGDLFPKRAAGLLNLALRRGRAFPIAVARRMIERLATETADFLLFSGDISTTSLKSEFRAARELLAPLRKKWDERFIAIPGNHDRYTPRAAGEKLFERLFLEKEIQYPITCELNGHWSAIGFDCSVPRLFDSTGEAGPQSIADLIKSMAAEKARGRRLLVMGHYPILYPANVRISSDHALASDQRQALRDAMRQAGAEVFLHGHKHRRWGLRDGVALHLNAGSAGMNGATEDRRPGYLKIELPATGAPRIEEHWLEESGAEGVAAGNWRQRELTIAEALAKQG